MQGVRRPLHEMIAFAAAAGEVDVDGFNAGERVRVDLEVPQG